MVFPIRGELTRYVYAGNHAFFEDGTMASAGGRVEQAFAHAKDEYAQWGVDVDNALSRLSAIAISIHCWQGDDVGGFENLGQELGGGLAVTGHYPGKARTADELRSDLDKALALLPGSHRLNLHASYAETGGRKVEREALEPEHFQAWIDWAKHKQVGMDFNPTYFAHPLAADGYTLAHPDRAVRQFWIDHGIACRRIGAAIGKALEQPCVTNVWIPDGCKDSPVDRKGPRQRSAQSLDAIFAEPLDRRHIRDAVEGKLFGIGSESYVVGSQEFYLGYALSRNKLLCLDTGHYHPTEVVSDKISAVLLYLDEILLHVSRGVRWDSDHVVVLSDELEAIAKSWCAAIIWGVFISDSISLMPVSTGWPPGSSARGPRSRRFCSPCSSPSKFCASSRPKATRRRAWRYWKRSRRFPSAPSGTITASREMYPPAATGWRRLRSMNGMCCPNGAEEGRAIRRIHVCPAFKLLRLPGRAAGFLLPPLQRGGEGGLMKSRCYLSDSTALGFQQLFHRGADLILDLSLRFQPRSGGIIKPGVPTPGPRLWHSIPLQFDSFLAPKGGEIPRNPAVFRERAASVSCE